MYQAYTAHCVCWVYLNNSPLGLSSFQGMRFSASSSEGVVMPMKYTLGFIIRIETPANFCMHIAHEKYWELLMG